MSNTKLSVPNNNMRRQSDNAPPVTDKVKVAVMPPRLPPGMAPPTGIGAAEAFSWDETLNYSHNNPIQNNEEGAKGKGGFFKKLGITTQRERANKDMPAFTFREVPYDTWRKHYAKDSEGNYRGTLAPAEDCILKPDDVAKWRLEEPKLERDKYTRGRTVLPTYGEGEEEGLPAYNKFEPPPGEPTIDSKAANAPALGSSTPATDRGTGETIADGKTAAEIIAEAKAKAASPEAKKSWKQRMKHASEIALMGS